MDITLENLLIITGCSIVLTGSCMFCWFICKDYQIERMRRDTTLTDVLLTERVQV